MQIFQYKFLQVSMYKNAYSHKQTFLQMLIILHYLFFSEKLPPLPLMDPVRGPDADIHVPVRLLLRLLHLFRGRP